MDRTGGSDVDGRTSSAPPAWASSSRHRAVPQPRLEHAAWPVRSSGRRGQHDRPSSCRAPSRARSGECPEHGRNPRSARSNVVGEGRYEVIGLDTVSQRWRHNRRRPRPSIEPEQFRRMCRSSMRCRRQRVECRRKRLFGGPARMYSAAALHEMSSSSRIIEQTSSYFLSTASGGMAIDTSGNVADALEATRCRSNGRLRRRSFGPVGRLQPGSRTLCS